MRTISLSQDKVAIVDDAEYEWISRWKWYVRKARRTFYAVRNERLSNGKQRTIRMHREILELSHGDGISVIIRTATALTIASKTFEPHRAPGICTTVECRSITQAALQVCTSSKK